MSAGDPGDGAASERPSGDPSAPPASAAPASAASASPTHYAHLADLAARVGQPVGTSPWFRIDQARIDRFAEATDDHQWIHVDAARAAAGPYGATVAHGFLTLALLAPMIEQAFTLGDRRMALNYGLNRVRFPAPLPVGSRVRAQLTLRAYEPVDGGAQLTLEVTVEREGHARPVCVAESLTRHYT